MSNLPLSCDNFPLKIPIFCVNFILSKGLKKYTNPQNNFVHMGSTPPFFYTMCKKTSDLAKDGFPWKAYISAPPGALNILMIY